MEKKVKPGYLTTEFWIALLVQAIPILVILGVLTPEEGEALSLTTGDAIVAVGALVTSLAPVWAYIKGRAQVKSSANGASVK